MKRLTTFQKILLPFIFNTLLFGAIFSLRFFGIPAEVVTITLTSVVSLEVIYLALFIQMSVNKNTERLQEVEKQILNIKEDEERAHAVLLYSRHQMRALQQELDFLRKNPYTKNGNGHHPKARA